MRTPAPGPSNAIEERLRFLLAPFTSLYFVVTRSSPSVPDHRVCKVVSKRLTDLLELGVTSCARIDVP